MCPWSALAAPAKVCYFHFKSPETPRGEWLGHTLIVRSMISREQVTNVTAVVADFLPAGRNKGTQSSGCLGVLRNNFC